MEISDTGPGIPAESLSKLFDPFFQAHNDHEVGVKGLGLGIMIGIYLLGVAVVMALILVNYVPAGFEAMFISFAAGGLAEMSLIALSLNFNPVVVALHHLARIFLTIWIGLLMFRFGFKQEARS